MVWVLAVVLGLLWAVAMANAVTAGGYVHLFLIVAVVLLAYGLYRHHRRERHA